MDNETNIQNTEEVEIPKGCPKTWRNVEISQQIEHGLTQEVIEAILKDWSPVSKFAYILHDKDIKADGSPVAFHFHLMIAFNSPVPTTAILARCEKFAPGVIKVQNLEKCKKWASAIAYLTHENVTGKHIYDRSEVVANFDISPEIEDALSGRARKNELLHKIEAGEIREFNIVDFCNVVEYAKWEKDIKKAFEYFRLKTLRNGGNRNMNCIYIQGESGCGKTSIAKDYCEKNGLSYFVSSGSNDVLDGYRGENVVILDDLRPSALRLADLLKMLDNNTASSVPSRYYNKVLYCTCIIITTTLDIDTFFKKVFAETPEAAKQLKRRCKELWKMTDKTLTIGVYNQFINDYCFARPIPNPIAVKYGLSKSETADILASSLSDSLSLFCSSDTCSAVVDQFKSQFLNDEDQSELPY